MSRGRIHTVNSVNWRVSGVMLPRLGSRAIPKYLLSLSRYFDIAVVLRDLQTERGERGAAGVPEREQPASNLSGRARWTFVRWSGYTLTFNLPCPPYGTNNAERSMRASGSCRLPLSRAWSCPPAAGSKL